MKALVSILFMVCSLQTKAQAKLPVDVVKQFFNAVNAHDTAALAAMFAYSARGESPNWGAKQTGNKIIAHEFARNFAGDSVLTFQLKNLIAAGSMVVAEYDFAGRISQTAEEVPVYMHGKSYHFAACSVFEIASGKISSIRSYFDQVDFLRQMGYFDR